MPRKKRFGIPVPRFKHWFVVIDDEKCLVLVVPIPKDVPLKFIEQHSEVLTFKEAVSYATNLARQLAKIFTHESTAKRPPCSNGFKVVIIRQPRLLAGASHPRSAVTMKDSRAISDWGES